MSDVESISVFVRAEDTEAALALLAGVAPSRDIERWPPSQGYMDLWRQLDIANVCVDEGYELLGALADAGLPFYGSTTGCFGAYYPVSFRALDTYVFRVPMPHGAFSPHCNPLRPESMVDLVNWQLWVFRALCGAVLDPDPTRLWVDCGPQGSDAPAPMSPVELANSCTRGRLDGLVAEMQRVLRSGPGRPEPAWQPGNLLALLAAALRHGAPPQLRDVVETFVVAWASRNLRP